MCCHQWGWFAMRIDVKGLRHSFRWAARGVCIALRERNFRIHLTAACYVTAAGFLADLSHAEIAVLCLCFGLVTAVELINTAIETLCDRITKQYDPLIRDAKDVAAGAVLMTALFSTAVALVLFAHPAPIRAILTKLTQHIWIDALLLASIPVAVAFVFAVEQKGEPK